MMSCTGGKVEDGSGYREKWQRRTRMESTGGSCLEDGATGGSGKGNFGSAFPYAGGGGGTKGRGAEKNQEQRVKVESVTIRDGCCRRIGQFFLRLKHLD